MNILLISSGYPPDFSGSGKRIKMTLDLIKKKYPEINYEVITKTRNTNLNYSNEVIYTYKNHSYKKFFFLFQIFKEYLEYKKIKKKINFSKYNVIHYVGFTWLSVFLSFYLKKQNKFQVRELTSLVDVYSRSLTFGRIIFNLFVSRHNNNADILIAISNKLKEDANIKHPSKKTYMKYNLIDIDSYNYNNLNKNNKVKSNKLISELKWSPESIIFLNIGHINENKNQIYLINQLKLLPNKYKLIIIGPTYEEDKYYFKKLNEIIYLNKLSDRILLINKYQKNISEYYFISDIFVLPSKMEGFGNVILESLAMGLPVLANKIEGVTDTIIENKINGHLFDINQNDFTLALKHCEKLLNKKKYISEIFFKKYNIDLLIDEYYSIYTNKKPINILAIDIEGGWGGSSKSLYNLINKSISPKKNFIVVCKALGPIYNKYKEINIDVIINRNIFNFIPRKKFNINFYIGSIINLLFFPIYFIQLLTYIKKYQIKIVHLNYEGLFLTGLFLKMFTKVRIISHFRTIIPENNLLSKTIIKIILYYADKIYAITSMEKKQILKIINKDINIEVLHNISQFEPLSKMVKFQDRKSLIYIGNIEYTKGVDKLIDLAKNLSKLKIDLIINIYGDERSSTNYTDTLKKKIKKYSLKNIIFRGYLHEPNKILNNSLLLLRPSRNNDPWGRDVIEAISCGIPVIASGEKSDFIKDQQNGYLVKNFDIDKITNIILKIYNNELLWNQLSKNSLKEVKSKINGNLQKKEYSYLLEHLSS